MSTGGRDGNRSKQTRGVAVCETSLTFEFTRAHGHLAGRAPTQDNLLVFYIPDPTEWAAAVRRMATAGFAPVPASNPYWDRHGRTFEDPDGYRVVLQHGARPGSGAALTIKS